MAVFAAILLMAVSGPGRAHPSGECDYKLSLTVRLAEGKARVAGWLLNELNTFQDTEEIISLMSTYLDTDTLFMESSQDLIECLNGPAVREEKPSTIAAPVDLEWLDGVLAGLDEPLEPEAPPGQLPERVVLGVDCSEPFTVSLPDDVLTECEGGQ